MDLEYGDLERSEIERRPTDMAWWREERVCWYALYTRSCWEKRVITLLNAHSIETYLPTQRVWNHRSTQKREIDAPVFPGYVFARCHLDKETWLTIKKASGVVRILGIGSDPVPVPDYEIDSLRKVLAVHPTIKGHPRLRKGDVVRVVKGPLQGVIGTLVEVARNRHKLIISINVINRAVSTSIDASLVERWDVG